MDDLARAKRWLDQMRPLPPEVTAELRHRYEVRLTHHSTAIEGNTLTQSETQIVIEKGVTIAGKSLREHLEIVGHKDAFDFVIDLASSGAPISEREIREIHALVMKGQTDDGGSYRSLDVKAAGTEYLYPSHLRIPELMADFITWLARAEQDIENAARAHLKFVTIHPFRDGNGRTGRLLMNLLLIRAGFPVAIIPVERRAEYIDSLQSAQKQGNDVGLISLVRDCVEVSLRDTVATCLSSSELRERLGDDSAAALAWVTGTS